MHLSACDRSGSDLHALLALGTGGNSTRGSGFTQTKQTRNSLTVGTRNGSNGIIYIDRLSDSFGYGQVTAGEPGTATEADLALGYMDSSGVNHSGAYIHEGKMAVGDNQLAPLTTLDVFGAMRRAPVIVPFSATPPLPRLKTKIPSR